MSVHWPVCPHRTTDIRQIFMIFENFLIICPEIQVLLKHGKNNGYLTWKPMKIYGNISLNSSEN
jgi:hypothetical protein